MRDFVCVNKTLPKDTIYKDVVIIGNGPSGISLSYMLSGHWPYWIKDKVNEHPDELLRARLNYADNKKSLVEQDLFTLADGLEGRSTNPVSLLLDSLQNPCADLGVEYPSMLEYKYHSEKEIDHVVLGKGPAGGSWHRMDPNLRTLSLSAWMSLPGLNFNEWNVRNSQRDDENDKHSFGEYKTSTKHSHNDSKTMKNVNNAGGTAGANYLKCKDCYELKINRRHSSINQFIINNNINCNSNNEENNGALKCCKHCYKSTDIENNNDTQQLKILKTNNLNNNSYENNNETNYFKLPRRNLSLKRQPSKEIETRALISRVAKYYESYVTEMNLNKYFINDTIVTTITPLKPESITGKYNKAQWAISGFNRLTNKPFTFVSRSLVLANGASDLANRLGVRGEGLSMPWVKYELPHLEHSLGKLSDSTRNKLKSVMIVGAGLSAADAVTICRQAGIHVIHVYRNRTAGLDKMLPEHVYPEYHEVHKMMKNSVNSYLLYTPLPEHTIADLSPVTNPNGSHKVTVQHLKTGELKELEVSYCAILIGSRPDLRFLSNITTTSAITSTIKCDENYDCNNNNLGFMCASPDTPNNMDQLMRLTKKLYWLKNICAKCKHLNLCDRTRAKNDYKHICGHNLHSVCECNLRVASPNMIILSPTTTIGTTTVITNKNVIDDTLLASGMGLGENPKKAIDCKTNPIDVDKYTNEVLNAPKGLYALGPLVGDNFVRFISGGALAITSALQKLSEND